MKRISLMDTIRPARRPQRVKNTLNFKSRTVGSKVLKADVSSILLRRQTITVHKTGTRTISSSITFQQSITTGGLRDRLLVTREVLTQSILLIKIRTFGTDNHLLLTQTITCKKVKARTVTSTLNLSAGVPQKIKGSKKGKVKIGNKWIDVEVDI